MAGPARSSIWWSTALAFLILAAGTTRAFAQQRVEIPPPRIPIDPALERLTVAKVGPWTISGLEFKLSYEFGPAFPKRERDSKKRYLDFMVYEKLLALDGLRRGLDRWPDVKRQVAEIQADLATEELYKQDVLSKVHITDKQLRKGMADDRVHLSLQWIFNRSASDADELAAQMKEGISFDTLYHRQLSTGVKSDDRSMEVTKFRLQMNNAFFAGIVDTLKVGEVSLPIHGPDGWYVVRMRDRSIRPVMTQTDEQKLEEDVRRQLTQQSADSCSDRYVRDLIASYHPTIRRGPFNAVQAFLASKFLTKAKVEEWTINSRKGAAELKSVSDLGPIADSTLVEARGGSLSVRDFLDWYRMRAPYAKMELSSPQGFFQSTEELVWRMVRDRFLARKAYSRKLQNLPEVRRQADWWKEKMLYSANKNRIADTIKDSLDLIRKYYDEHQNTFRDRQGNPEPFDSVKDDARRQYYAAELTKRLLHEILRLKQTYGVTIDDAALNRIKVDEQNNPRTIDVYTVKAKGIYPRMAFPSIDYEWQSWD